MKEHVRFSQKYIYIKYKTASHSYENLRLILTFDFTCKRVNDSQCENRTKNQVKNRVGIWEPPNINIFSPMHLKI
jgi:hypothetical protein